jgi:hypothetical protein
MKQFPVTSLGIFPVFGPKCTFFGQFFKKTHIFVPILWALAGIFIEDEFLT